VVSSRGSGLKPRQRLQRLPDPNGQSWAAIGSVSKAVGRDPFGQLQRLPQKAPPEEPRLILAVKIRGPGTPEQARSMLVI